MFCREESSEALQPGDLLLAVEMLWREESINMNFNFVEETSDVVMAGSGSFLELLEIYRPVQMHQANRSQYAPDIIGYFEEN